jgi:spermidine synthase
VEAAVPEHLTTVEFLLEARRALAAGGLYVANLADRPPLREARIEAATAAAVFAQVALIAEPAQFKGRRHGNLVLLAGDGGLPEHRLARSLASGAVRARLMTPTEVRGFASAAVARRDRPQD